MSDVEKITMTERKYQFWKLRRSTLTEEEEKAFKAYEAERYKVYKVDYKVPEKKIATGVNRNWLAQKFVEVFEREQGKKLIVTEETKPYYSAITDYFARNKDFENCTITENRPSLDKGLLIIGKCGCGKTAMLSTFHSIGKEIYKQSAQTILWFRVISCNALVNEYEGLANTHKSNFMERYIKGVVYFDDFGTEEEASNYGKKNIMKDILEERYLRKNKCHLTTNLSLEEIQEKYGIRVFDRINEMFNIIVMKGGSLRN
ncbi:hypothetical protein ACQ1PF_08000 [Ornithobacterium rhinotracheale]